MREHIVMLTLVALFFPGNTLYAQKLTVGFKGGLSVPNLTTGGSETPLNAGYSSNIRAGGGMYGEYHINRKFSISVGAEYSTQGGVMEKFETLTNDALSPATIYSDYKFETKLDYILVPVLARYSWQKNKRSRMKVHAAIGPFAGYLLKANDVRSYFATYEDEARTLLIDEVYSSEKVDIKDVLYTFNVGIEGLAGLSYSLNKKHALFIEGGINYGFLSINRVEAAGKNFTGAAFVNLGYTYTLQKQRSGRRR
jgi:hypothetical protein